MLLMKATALLVAVYQQMHLLQLILHHAASLKTGGVGEMQRRKRWEKSAEPRGGERRKDYIINKGTSRFTFKQTALSPQPTRVAFPLLFIVC